MGAGGMSPDREAALVALMTELRLAETAWRRASDHLAAADRRLFALHPKPPESILLPGPQRSYVPKTWSALRRHLSRLRDSPATGRERLAVARRDWAAHRAALKNFVVPAWHEAAQAAEEAAAVRIAALQRRIATTPARSLHGAKIKLVLLRHWIAPDADEFAMALLRSLNADLSAIAGSAEEVGS
jgi:hypothetical protein